MFNEATILIILTSSIRYADREPSPEVASFWGFVQIGILSLNIVINLGYFVFENGKLVLNQIRDFLKKRSQSQQTVKI